MFINQQIFKARLDEQGGCHRYIRVLLTWHEQFNHHQQS